VCFGDGDLPDGWEHWLVKFERPEDDADCARREAAWMAMAETAGLEVAAFEVIDLGDVGKAFATRRFDRMGAVPVHMLSAAGALNVDFRRNFADYQQLGRLCALICDGDLRQVAALVRRAMFNVVACNEDDHLKNLAWLYDGKSWVLSPGYDLTFSPHASGFRQTSVMDLAQGIRRDHLLALGRRLGLSVRATTEMLDEVLSAASGVEGVLAAWGCTGPVSQRAAAEVRAQVARLRE